ncbi:MAG TPA: hypothetical protein VMU95_25070 [Trebonia sp.]|nr:hypothetical protein [Trebonia sp.]
MPWEAAPSTGQAYYFLQLDSSGAGVEPGDRQFLSQPGDDAVIAADTTDVFVISHGWMEDVDAAKRNYGEWIDTMVEQGEHGDTLRGPGYKPKAVAVHWPSEPFGDERPLAAADDLADQYTRRILGSTGAGADPARSASAHAALKAIVDSADDIAHDTVARRNLVRGELGQLPKLNDAYQQLFAATGRTRPGLDPGQAIRDWTVAVHREPPPSGFLDHIVLEVERLWDELIMALEQDATKVRSLALLPARALSFWSIKDRAHAIGAGTMHQFLVRLEEAAPRARLHLMGHSFGAIVASSAIVGPPAGSAGGGPLPRPVTSALFAQGAMSLWSYAPHDPFDTGEAGDYRSIYAGGRPLVAGPLVTTTSVFDLANRILFPIAARLGSPDLQALVAAPSAPAGEQGAGGAFPPIGAVGTFGLQGVSGRADARTVERALTGVPRQDYQLESGRICNADADAVIRKVQGLMGAHMDINHPEIAHLFWQAVRAGAHAE